MTATRIPVADARRVVDEKPNLLLTTEHHLCPGCGEPIAIRQMLEAIEDVGRANQCIAVAGIGCYTQFAMTVDVDLVQALHGRAPSVAAGVKRMQPEALVFTFQGDGDMVNEGLQEVLHTAARGEPITVVLLNNGVFGETGGHMTATTVIGQRTKNTIEGRHADYHGYPILIGDLIAQLQGVAYAARASVHNPAGVARAKRYLRKAFDHQIAGHGFSFVELLTMCPTGWFIPTAEGPGYQNDVIADVHVVGELRDGTTHRTTEDLKAEWTRKAAERAHAFDLEEAPEGEH
jgi:2-oxoglutarate/2-oxoacid ferredoxin oxidoreductase subunit beta